MIIDIHQHFYPDRLAPRVLRRLSAASGLQPVTDGTLQGTRQKNKEWGVDKAVLLPVATSPDCGAVNRFALASAAAESAGGDIIPFGAIHPDTPEPEAVLEELAAAGCRGVKLHPQYQNADIDDPRCVRIIRRAAALRLPVLFHAGFDPGLPPPWRAAPDAILRLLRQVEGLPGLTLIAAHLGSLDMYDEVEEKLLGHDLWLDTAMSHGRLSPEQLYRIIRRQGWQRVLLGSDCPWEKASDSIADIRALHLPKEQEEGILGGNAAAMLGLS
ncbi:MAG: amidohydrolase family protein [Firmicutes bacterium]|nr:amidohydrolase family protein [Bacillota bacterium]